jgi:hypothetical protein
MEAASLGECGAVAGYFSEGAGDWLLLWWLMEKKPPLFSPEGVERPVREGRWAEEAERLEEEKKECFLAGAGFVG